MSVIGIVVESSRRQAPAPLALRIFPELPALADGGGLKAAAERPVPQRRLPAGYLATVVVPPP